SIFRTYVLKLGKKGSKVMFVYKIDEELSLRMFNEKDATEFFQLTIQSKEYLKEWLGWLDYTNEEEDSLAFIKATLKGVIETGGYPKT
ncbi:hypothetical protein K4G93_23275, partial [Mycobacterium tuberculosis]|nr:hypothetical protein [Mycobacterium tuberculosis]